MEQGHQHDPAETKRFTLVELYELRRVIILHSRSIPPGPDRDEHRQVARSMRFLIKDKVWLAAHTVGIRKTAVSHEIRNGRMIPKIG